MRYLLILMLAGCATVEPTVIQSRIGDVVVFEVLDAPVVPEACGPKIEWQACTVKVGKLCTIYRSKWAGPEVIKHEMAHCQGMVHTPWQRNAVGIQCSTVMIGAAGYEAGTGICYDAGGERIVR